MGRAYLVTWAVLCFQFHTHRSLRHSKASCYFQTVAELHLSVHNLCPSKPCPSKPRPFAQIRTDTSAHVHIFTAQRYTFKNWGFKCTVITIFLPFTTSPFTAPWPTTLLQGMLMLLGSCVPHTSQAGSPCTESRWTRWILAEEDGGPSELGNLWWKPAAARNWACHFSPGE